MRILHLAAPALLGLLAACATSPAYGPADGSGFGYKDTRIENDRYRVSYRGGDQAGAEDGALRRAAELAVAQGADWFTVVSRSTEGEMRRSGPSIGIGGGTGGRRGGVGLGVQVPLGGGSGGARTVLLEVLIGSGPRPDGPQTYDARSVLSNAG